MNRQTIIILGYLCLGVSFMFDQLNYRLFFQGMSLGFFIRSAYIGIKQYLDKKK